MVVAVVGAEVVVDEVDDVGAVVAEAVGVIVVGVVDIVCGGVGGVILCAARLALLSRSCT